MRIDISQIDPVEKSVFWFTQNGKSYSRWVALNQLDRVTGHPRRCCDHLLTKKKVIGSDAAESSNEPGVSDCKFQCYGIGKVIRETSVKLVES